MTTTCDPIGSTDLHRLAQPGSGAPSPELGSARSVVRGALALRQGRTAEPVTGAG